MTNIVLPNTIDAGSEIVAAEHQQNYEAIRDVVNGQLDAGNITNNTLTDTEFAASAGMYTAYRTLVRAASPISLDKVAGTYILGKNGLITPALPGNAISGGAATPFEPIYLDDADYTVSGRTTNLRIRGVVSTNGTAPAITFTFGLYPVTFSGAADDLTTTLGAVVGSSTAAIASPGANASTPAVSSTFAVPADGVYVLGVATSGTLANNAAAWLTADLQLRWA